MKLTGSQTHLSYGSSWKTFHSVNRVSMADVVDSLVSWIGSHTADRSTIIKCGVLWPISLRVEYVLQESCIHFLYTQLRYQYLWHHCQIWSHCLNADDIAFM